MLSMTLGERVMTGRFAVVVLLLPILGCSIPGCSTMGHEAPTSSALPDSDRIDREVSAKPASRKTLRKAVGVYQMGKLGVRTWYLDPIIRPVSTLKSGVALVVKSTLGTVYRALLNPKLDSQPDEIAALRHRASMDTDSLDRHLDRIGAGVRTRGEIRLLVDGEEYFSRLQQAIAEARQSIDVRTYIFDNDDVAVNIAHQLKHRAGEGVGVRILLDGVGVWLGEQADAASVDPAYRPPLSMVSYLRRRSNIKVRIQTNPWLTGDHAKTTIIDGSVAFLGGMNIGREYRYEWHDLMMEVNGPVVALLEKDAEKAWARASLLGDLAWLGRTVFSKRERSGDQGYPIRVLFTRDHNSQIYRAQLAAARRAQSRIYIENPYFSDDLMLYELVQARQRGVDVRVVMADDGNHPMMNWSNQLAVNTMIRNGIRVYRYPGMAHTKAAIFDGWACLGSANFDKLSLQMNDEINLATSDPALVNELLERVFEVDMSISTEVSTMQIVGIKNRFAEAVADFVL
jgi:cardiolipin synthase